MSSEVCEKCGVEIQIGLWPFCPHDPYGGTVIGDECDVWIKHGICNPDGSPKRYRSKSEMRTAAFEKGLFQGGDTPKVNQRLVEAKQKAHETKQ